MADPKLAPAKDKTEDKTKPKRDNGQFKKYGHLESDGSFMGQQPRNIKLAVDARKIDMSIEQVSGSLPMS